MTIDLTPEEIERYAPYHTFYEFMTGFNQWPHGRCPYPRDSVGAQAYDRGAECAMRRQRKAVL